MSPARRALATAILGALLGLIPLSVPVAKEPLYMAPVLPFFYALVALALVAPDRTPERYARVNRGAAQVSLTIAALVAMSWLTDVLLGPRTLLAVLLPLLQVAIWTAPSLCVLARRSVAPSVLPCALASLLIAAISELTRPFGFT